VFLLRRTAGGAAIRDLLGKLLASGEELPGRSVADEVLRLGETIGLRAHGAAILLDRGFQLRPDGGDRPDVGICTFVPLREAPREAPGGDR
jgi:hypothetical protein